MGEQQLGQGCGELRVTLSTQWGHQEDIGRQIWDSAETLQLWEPRQLLSCFALESQGSQEQGWKQGRVSTTPTQPGYSFQPSL